MTELREYGIFYRLIIPLMKPAFSAMAILNGMNALEQLFVAASCNQVFAEVSFNFGSEYID